MAERRMLSKKIVGEDKFLDMPSTARLLYYDLIIYADDDGFVSPKKIMRITQASDDDLKLLIAKGYILIFDSGVVVIKHWRIHNQLRKDRHHATIFLAELELMQLTNNEYNFVVNTGFIDDGNQMATTGIQNGNQMATEDRIGKDRIEEDRIGKTLSVCVSPVQTDLKIDKHNYDYNSIMNMYNHICNQLPKMKSVTVNRMKLIDDVLSNYTIDDIEQVFNKSADSDFLSGKVSTTGFKASFDWIMKVDNFTKVIEDTYKNNNAKARKTAFNEFQQRTDDDKGYMDYITDITNKLSKST